MTVQDLHVLPKFGDGWSYLYVEHCRIERELHAVALFDAEGKVPVPCASLALLMLGPGVSISHAAIATLADHGCLVAWCGEGLTRFYAAGMGETRSSANLLHQARMWASPQERLEVVRRLYQMRFPERLDPKLTLRQIRGMEGIRVRRAYAELSRQTGVPWSGRSYQRGRWNAADPVNRALSAANSCLYGICHAAIVSAGFSPAIGFIHTGKMLSFVYDIADLYKTEITVPVAFRVAAEGPSDVERRTRHCCREAFSSRRLLQRIIPDIKAVLDIHETGTASEEELYDEDGAAPGGLWDPDQGLAEGGTLYLPDESGFEEGPKDDGADT